MQPLACWDCGLESSWGNKCLSRVIVVCCQVEVSASDWSPVQMSPTECGVSNEWDCEAPKKGGQDPESDRSATKTKYE